MEAEPRDVVRWFAIEMERALRANDHKGGWEHESVYDLYWRMRDEIMEMTEAIIDVDDASAARKAVDVANFAMMIWDVAQKEAKHE